MDNVQRLWLYNINSFSNTCFTYIYLFKQKWKGGQSGTYQRLTISGVGSAGERRKDVAMKRKI